MQKFEITVGTLDHRLNLVEKSQLECQVTRQKRGCAVFINNLIGNLSSLLGCFLWFVLYFHM